MPLSFYTEQERREQVQKSTPTGLSFYTSEERAKQNIPAPEGLASLVAPEKPKPSRAVMGFPGMDSIAAAPPEMQTDIAKNALATVFDLAERPSQAVLGAQMAIGEMQRGIMKGDIRGGAKGAGEALKRGILRPLLGEGSIEPEEVLDPYIPSAIKESESTAVQFFMRHLPAEVVRVASDPIMWVPFIGQYKKNVKAAQETGRLAGVKALNKEIASEVWDDAVAAFAKEDKTRAGRQLVNVLKKVDTSKRADMLKGFVGEGGEVAPQAITRAPKASKGVEYPKGLTQGLVDMEQAAALRESGVVGVQAAKAQRAVNNQTRLARVARPPLEPRTVKTSAAKAGLVGSVEPPVPVKGIDIPTPKAVVDVLMPPKRVGKAIKPKASPKIDVKAERKMLLQQIDEALKTAPETIVKDDRGKYVRQISVDEAGYVDISLPSGAKMRVENHTEALRQARKNINKVYSKPSSPKTSHPSPKATLAKWEKDFPSLQGEEAVIQKENISQLKKYMDTLKKPLKGEKGAVQIGGKEGSDDAARRMLDRNKRVAHQLVRRLNLPDDEFRSIKVEITGKTSMKDMTHAEARAVRKQLEKEVKETTKSLHRLNRMTKQGVTEDDLLIEAMELTGRTDISALSDLPSHEIRILDDVLTTKVENVNMLSKVRTIRNQLPNSGIFDDMQRAYDDANAFRLAHARRFGETLGSRVKDKDFLNRLGSALDGQAKVAPELGWQPDEIEIFSRVRAQLDELHREFGFEEGQYLADYFPHVWDSLASSASENIASGSRIGGEVTAKELGKVIPKELFFAHELKRRGAKGYSMNAAKAFDSYLYWGSRKKFMQPQIDKWRPVIVDSKHLTTRSRDFYRDWFNDMLGKSDEMSRFWVNFYDGLRAKGVPVPEGWDGRNMTNWFRESMYAGALGFKPSFAVRNLTQQLHTVGELNQRWWANGWKLYGKRMVDKEVDGLLEEVAPRLLREFQPGLSRKGGYTGYRSGYQKINDKYMNSAMFFVRQSDKINRQVSFLGAYSKAMVKGQKLKLTNLRSVDAKKIKSLLKQGKTREAAIEYGLTVSDNTQWVYSKVTRPPGFRGPIGKHMGVFMTWPSNYVDWVIRQGTNGQGWKGLFSFEGKAKLANYILSTMALTYGASEALDIDISRFFGFYAMPNELPLFGTLMKGSYDAAIGGARVGWTNLTTGGRGDTRYAERQMKEGIREVKQSLPAVGYGIKVPVLAGRDILRTKAAYEQVGAGEALKEALHLGTLKYDRRFAGDDVLPGPFTFTLPEYRAKKPARKKRERRPRRPRR